MKFILFSLIIAISSPSFASEHNEYDHDKESLADSIARLEEYTNALQKSIDDGNEYTDSVIKNKQLSEEFNKSLEESKIFIKADNGESEFLDASAKFCTNVMIVRGGSFAKDSKIRKEYFDRCMKSFVDHRTYMLYSNFFVNSRTHTMDEPPKPWMWPFNQSQKTDLE